MFSPCQVNDNLPMRGGHMLKFLFLGAFLLCSPALAAAAEPMSTAPHVNPVPGEFGAGSQPLTGALPPSFPEYLPNGAVNLDEAWIQDGGARYYWNTIIVPRQLKMGGAYWIDPALVPRLTIQPQQRRKVARRSYRRTAPVSRVVTPAPVNASSRALRSPAIPLPVEPVPGSAIVPPPFSPAQNRAVTPTDSAVPAQPPRLQ